MFEKIIRFRYWILFGLFVVWMLFFDSNNLIYRLSVAGEINELEKARTEFTRSIADLRRQRTELFGNVRNIEKFAREKYLMKRDNEDLFVLVVDSSEKK